MTITSLSKSQDIVTPNFHTKQLRHRMATMTSLPDLKHYHTSAHQHLEMPSDASISLPPIRANREGEDMVTSLQDIHNITRQLSRVAPGHSSIAPRRYSNVPLCDLLTSSQASMPPSAHGRGPYKNPVLSHQGRPTQQGQIKSTLDFQRDLYLQDLGREHERDVERLKGPGDASLIGNADCLFPSRDWVAVDKAGPRKPSPLSERAHSKDIWHVNEAVEVERNSLADYVLKIRQQPAAARACGFGERDRRVIDPPPIVELQATLPGSTDIATNELRYPFNIVQVSLWNEQGSEDTTMLEQTKNLPQRRLMGSLVASAAVAHDENDSEGAFFCFPDLSCRTAGRYRLHFVLVRLDPTSDPPGGFTPFAANVMSDVFTVYTAKEFPGMRPSTSLTRILKRQGISIQVKKGKRPGALKHKNDERSEGNGIYESAGKASKRVSKANFPY